MMAEKLDDRGTDMPAPAGEGGTTDVRLRAVEVQLARVDERLSRIESELKQHFATKAWILAGVLGGMGVAAAIAGVIVKVF